MANEGLIPHGAARLPGKEWQPQPEEGECVLLATHVDRGFFCRRVFSSVVS